MLGTDQFVQIGQVLKSNGTDGQVVIGLRGMGPEEISEKEPVFIFFDELPVPFFLKDVTQRGGNRVLAYLTDVNSLDDAMELTGRAVYVPQDGCSAVGGEDFVGWKLLPSGWPESRMLDITGFEDIPGNPCLEVGEILVPLHEDLVVSIDERKKIITMNVPQGLL